MDNPVPSPYKDGEVTAATAAPHMPHAATAPLPTLATAPPPKPLLLWLFDKLHQETMKKLMAKVVVVADIVPATSAEEADSLLDLNAGFHFLICPGGHWLTWMAGLVRAKRPSLPIIVFENYDHLTQHKCLAAGAAFVAPHVDVLKDYLLKHGPLAPAITAPPPQQLHQQQHLLMPAASPVMAGGFGASGVPDHLPPPFSPYRMPRSPTPSDHVVWPQIGSVVYSEATKIQYTITGRLGEGGYAHVFKCSDFFGQNFVMKILKTFKPKHETEAEWQKEARFLLSLRHPNIIQIYDMFEFYGLYYLIVEECDGSLRHLVEKTGQLPAHDVIDIAGQMLSGLHHIHTHSVIHRDLQIDNILYVRSVDSKRSPDGQEERPTYQIKITDFGISKFNGQAGDMGLPAYTNIGRPYDVAPELIVAGYTTHQSDIYQVGLVLYYLYRGSPAVGKEDGPSSQAIATGVARHRAESIGTPLGDVIARMLRRHVDWRFRDSVEVWTELCRVRQLLDASLLTYQRQVLPSGAGTTTTTGLLQPQKEGEGEGEDAMDSVPQHEESHDGGDTFRDAPEAKRKRASQEAPLQEGGPALVSSGDTAPAVDATMRVEESDEKAAEKVASLPV